MGIKKVQVLKVENNSDELFNRWNVEYKKNIKCSVSGCLNYSGNKAFFVKGLVGFDKFITPLCIECYEGEINYENQSTYKFVDLNGYLEIEDNLLMKVNNE